MKLRRILIMTKSKVGKKRESPRDRKIGPITESLTGIVKLPDDFDEKDFMSHVFVEKHGLKESSCRPENPLRKPAEKQKNSELFRF